MTEEDPAPEKNTRYDVMIGAKTYTSVTLKQVKEWIAKGRLKGMHLVRTSEEFSSRRKWRKAATLKELRPLFEK